VLQVRSKLSNAGIRRREKRLHAKHDYSAQRSRSSIRRLGAAVITGVLLVAALGIIGSTPAQAAYTFTNKTTGNGLGSNSVNGVFAVGDTVYAATSNGLSISTDGGASFTNYTTANGLGDNAVFGVYAVGTTIYAATGNGLSISTDITATTAFTNYTTGLGSNTVNGVFAVGTTVYAATLGGLSVSINSGGTWTNKTTSDGLGDNFVYGVYAVGTTVYAATGGGLSISTNSGGIFTNRTSANNALGGNSVRGVYVVAGTPNNTVYAATTNGLSISTDGGTSFTNKTTGNGLGNDRVFGVSARGSNVYAATFGGLSISADNGATFTNYTTGNGLGSNNVKGVAVGSTIYAATFSGLSLATGFPTQSVTSFGPGTVPSSLEVSWTTANPSPLVMIGIAKAAAFSPTDPCDGFNWQLAAADPANSVGYFFQDDVSNPHEFTSYTEWGEENLITVEPSTQYVACYFFVVDGDGPVGSGTPVYATTATPPATSTVSFNYNGATGGTSVTSATVPVGSQADADFPLPTKSGEVFTGWFNTQSLLFGQRITTIDDSVTGELVAGFIPPELAQALNLTLPPPPSPSP
jgi:hypothetical protein